MSEIRGVPQKENFTPCEVYDKKIHTERLYFMFTEFVQLHFSTENWSFKKQENLMGCFHHFLEEI